MACRPGPSTATRATIGHSCATTKSRASVRPRSSPSSCPIEYGQAKSWNSVFERVARRVVAPACDGAERGDGEAEQRENDVRERGDDVRRVVDEIEGVHQPEREGQTAEKQDYQ